jgi:hypothetical protein
VEESFPEMQGTSECDAEEELDEEKGVKKRKRSNGMYQCSQYAFSRQPEG